MRSPISVSPLVSRQVPPWNSIAAPTGLLLMADWIRPASELLSWQLTLIVAVGAASVTEEEEEPEGVPAVMLWAGRTTQATPKPTHAATITPATISGQRRRMNRRRWPLPEV